MSDETNPTIIQVFQIFFFFRSEWNQESVTSLSPFLIQKTIESYVGTPKSVKRLRNQTLLIKLSKESQIEQLKNKQTNKNGDIRVKTEVHSTLNSSKGFIKNSALKECSGEENIKNLKSQGVATAKRFKVKRDGKLISTNTMLLTFNSIIQPKSLRIFYRVFSVEAYVPNPLRCFICKKLGQHEDNCQQSDGNVCPADLLVLLQNVNSSQIC